MLQHQAAIDAESNIIATWNLNCIQQIKKKILWTLTFMSKENIKY